MRTNSFKDGQMFEGDCLDIMPLIDCKVDLILADLPFNTTQNEWDNAIDLQLIWKCYKRLARPNTAIVLFAQKPFDILLGASNFKELRYEWIWQKEKGTGFLNANKMPLKSHENILVFYEKLPTFNPQKEKGKPYIKNKNNQTSNYGKYNSFAAKSEDGTRYPTSILFFESDSQKGNSFHPTQKPVALLEYLIKTYTNEGELVLDNTIGSGSTAVAAINQNRKFIGIEKDPIYFDIACKRISEAAAQVNLF